MNIEFLAVLAAAFCTVGSGFIAWKTLYVPFQLKLQKVQLQWVRNQQCLKSQNAQLWDLNLFLQLDIMNEGQQLGYLDDFVIYFRSEATASEYWYIPRACLTVDEYIQLRMENRLEKAESERAFQPITLDRKQRVSKSIMFTPDLSNEEFPINLPQELYRVEFLTRQNDRLDWTLAADFHIQLSEKYVRKFGGPDPNHASS